ncbi:uncharacterized protein VTP21DRAFT_5320 [Calcarisporiella thermophila]|uniref:uncharacterized protein n=1 Tax=Calcarisporiella thermophila TaxID=911321 RepID=UPI00374413E4
MPKYFYIFSTIPSKYFLFATVTLLFFNNILEPIRKKIRERVLELSRKGESTRKVAARMGISCETARKIIKEWSTPKYPPMKPKYGRPRSLSESDEKYITKKASTGECSKLADLQQVIKEELNKSVTNKIVKMMLRRHETRGKEYTYVKKGQPLRECNIIPTTKQGNEAIMVWGCITSQGVGLLLRVEGGINARMYQILLDEGFLGTLERYGMDKDKNVFQHDNAPPSYRQVNSNVAARSQYQGLRMACSITRLESHRKRVEPLEEEASRLSYSAKG